MTDLIVQLIARSGYLGIFLLMALENIFPPIPSEVIMGLGGIAVAHGKMAMVPLIVAGTLGTTAGNYAWYALGRRFGVAPLKPVVARWGRWLTIEWHDVERLHAFFQRHGEWVVFVFRFMPAFRTIVSLPAGMARMKHWKFCLWTTAGAAIWNTLLAWSGWYLGARFRMLEAWFGPASVAIMVAVAVVYAWRVVTWKPRGK
ncbi:DedA family protein [Sphingomonas populi]|uniref:DedA family protein n=1 Tax=Sphingomonas populi TaxID=2484750 RepID=A0A4Q6XUT9_9SPHN|nr:DedA family protein [Sphingomonas populi]RZF64363.1 DedA family protein [Sphingomonas populi]